MLKPMDGTPAIAARPLTLGPSGTSRWSRWLAHVRWPNRLAPRHRERLREAAGRLDRLCRTSGEAFMELGEHLQRFHRQSQEIQAQGRTATEALGGAEVTATIERLHRVVQRVETALASGQRQVEAVAATLSDVSRALQAMAAPLHDIGRSVRSLRMLSTTTRAESARLGRTEEGFVALTDQVTSHSREVTGRMEAMLAEVGELQAGVDGAMRRVAAFRATQAGELSRVIERVQAAVGALSDTRAAQGRSVEAMADASGRVVRAVGEMVTSLQYHDITRQQMEHVSQALDALSAHEGRMHLPAFLGLQANQLVRARDDLVSAVHTATASLRTIAELARTTVHGLDEGHEEGRFGQRYQAFLEALGDQIQEAAAAMQAYGRMMDDVQRLLDELTRALASMNRFADGVAGIGYAIRLIALNTSVKAAALGPAGRALDVLAGQVQELSGQATASADAFNEALGQAVELAERLRSQAGSTPGADSVASVQTELDESLSQIARLTAQALDAVEGMERGGGALATDIEALVNATDTDRLAAHAVDAVLELLRETAAMPSVAALLAARPRAQDAAVAALAQRYTSSVQRRIHRAWLGLTRGPAQGTPADEPAEPTERTEWTEPASMLPQEPAHPEEPGLPPGAASGHDPDADSLGSNVELF